jgi:hypothetical protein
MEIIIRCQKCSNPFAFDEEPVNGRVAGQVRCPNCSNDCTDQANDFVFKTLQGKDPLAQPKSFFSRFSSAARQQDELLHLKRKDRSKPVEAPEVAQRKNRMRIIMGAVAALTAGMACAFGWYWLAITTGFYFGFIAWIIGGIVGGLCRVMAPSGGILLAGIAGGSAGIAILIGHMAVLQVQLNHLIKKGTGTSYLEAAAYAKEAAVAKTDPDVKLLYERHFPAKDLKRPETFGTNLVGRLMPDHIQNILQMKHSLLGFVTLADCPGSIFQSKTKIGGAPDYTPEEIKQFWGQEQALAKEFAAGKPPRAEWEASLATQIRNRISLSQLAAESFEPYTLLWILLGLGTASRLAYNKSETEDV